MIAFFHQNDVVYPKGGIERYLATLLETGGHGACIVTEQVGESGPNCIGVKFRGPEALPRWLRFSLGIIADRRRIASELARRNARTLEFSRPEYAVFSGLFAGRRVFTFHGQGGLWKVAPIKRFIHLAACYLLPFVGSRMQVVGRDNRGMPAPVRGWFKNRIDQIDAWFDNQFRATPLPPLTPFKVCYSGRLTEEKNPGLLIEVIRMAQTDLPFPVQFVYFGPDSAVLEEARLGPILLDLGLLNINQLVKAVGECHAGMLCSHFEGSPFAMIETLGSGRCFISSPLPNVMASYQNISGVFFAERYAADGFLKAISEARDYLAAGATPEQIADGVADRAQDKMAPRLIKNLANG